MNRFGEGWLPGSGRRNLESSGNKIDKFPSEHVNNMNGFWEGWLPVSGRGNLGSGAQATKVNSFLKKLLTT